MPQPQKKSLEQAEAEELDVRMGHGIEHALSMHLRPGVPLAPQSIGELFAMVVIMAHRKGVSNEFFSDVLDNAIRGISLLECYKAENRLIDVVPMDDKLREAMTAACKLSNTEISVVRDKLGDQFDLIRQCKPDGVSLQ
jgi:hypothetical protein